MKKIITLCILSFSALAFTQVYDGKNDQKLQIGPIFTNGGAGLYSTYDLGLGKNISVGVAASYLLDKKSVTENGVEYKPDFYDRADVKGRLNVHLMDVLNISDTFDVYPGINLGIHNLGFHTGTRYFFSEGFGVFAEFDMPIAKYDSDAYIDYYDKFKFSFGVSLNLD